ncbi:DUF1905 domain-containing protein [Blastococcus sp. MG754426]|uniref:DUF1905 domain-containing protein n=1 Tax=unclassified Blastococcus TaxID=2619396 RepID=UPI001EF05E2D|nr:MULTISPECIES: DUF1905 domain-containing protein [unclassified Blastococcus]MCF6506166.1 DUF1905 domain-containing protein [Blastococcus sp. MG754426]MCF6510456.1 DUF1905 domain-containing protein [Blastococcus sp. MG754427]MCF6735587.1 DUF1905 domain-containing protein [Blastococcus sp. KM273129]
MTETFTAVLWVHDGPAGWHFLTLPPEVADDVREAGAAVRAGFGSVRVTATVGGTSWRTSVFPDARSGSYLLPVKRPVRAAEGLRAGDRVVVQLAVSRDPAPRRGG